MQCDRHGQNVFVDATGHITLIDLDQALGDAWRVCGVDSLFLPTTQKFLINAIGYWYVMKIGQSRPRAHAALQSAFDYRCHVEGGAIGTAYPERLQQCLGAISSMSYSEVRPATPPACLLSAGCLMSPLDCSHPRLTALSVADQVSKCASTRQHSAA
jgi:hypothetical protein